MSWWVNVPREQFAEKCAAEQARMQASRFGRMQWMDGGTPSHLWRPPKARTSEEE